MKKYYLLFWIVPALLGIWSIFLFDDYSGIYVLLVGSFVTLLLIELFLVPHLLKQYREIRTSGKQKYSNQNRGDQLRKIRFPVVIIGLILSAIFRNYFRDIMLYVIPFILGGLTMFFLRVGWLSYRFKNNEEV